MPLASATVTAYTIAAVLLGVLTRRNLASLRYRRPSEADRPLPSSTRWVPPVSALAAALVSWCAMPNQWRSLLVATPLLAAGPWLAAVDIDVRRLPDRVLLPVAGFTLVAIVALAAIDPPVLLRALGCGFAGFAIYFALHLVSGGSIGFGDVKLAGVVGLVAGFHGLATVWWSFLAGPLLCVAWAVLTRRGLRDRVAFGPWLVAGLLVALVLT
ncbi:prepilin peptidase [Flexivirga caeni]|uniref:prepilin peptidase n=1 Tax=Flexivirga caeni TaxID=2294115 RepID=UPI0011CDBCF2|nr:A24 family peptidase [Flexivirga caeni]